jgi:hypothetical protein
MKIFLTRILLVSISLTVLSSCSSNKKLQSTTNNVRVISEVTSNKTLLSRKDVVNYYCSYLTEYFNTYKYYKISTENYTEKDKQNSISTSKISEHGGLYYVEYIGSSGRYIIIFSSKQFPESEQIFTFGKGTVLGNAIRTKIYSTFSAWFTRVGIDLKANGNTAFYKDEINAIVELEDWHNKMNQ